MAVKEDLEMGATGGTLPSMVANKSLNQKPTPKKLTKMKESISAPSDDPDGATHTVPNSSPKATKRAMNSTKPVAAKPTTTAPSTPAAGMHEAYRDGKLLHFAFGEHDMWQKAARMCGANGFDHRVEEGSSVTRGRNPQQLIMAMWFHRPNQDAHGYVYTESTDGASAGVTGTPLGRGTSPAYKGTGNYKNKRVTKLAETQSSYGIVPDRALSGQKVKSVTPKLKQRSPDKMTDVDGINEIAMSVGGGSVSPIAPPDASAVYSLQRERYKKMIMKGIIRRKKPK